MRGAEVIVRPSALLRSADIWELTNRARAYDNHVFLVGANATGVGRRRRALLRQLAHGHTGRPRWWPGLRGTRAGSAARLDPEEGDRLAHAGLQRPPGLRPLADRNLDLIRRYREDLERPATTSFPHA